MLDTREVGLLKSVEQLLSDIFIPTLRNINHGWGDVASPQAQVVKQEFISSLENFVTVLSVTQDCLREKVEKFDTVVVLSIFVNIFSLCLSHKLKKT